MPNQELNNRGVPIYHSPVRYASDLSDHETKQLLLLLIDTLKLKAEFTNDNKAGITALVINPKPQE